METYDYGQASATPIGMLGAILAPSAVSVVVGLALLVLVIIGAWKMFEKAGEAGWKSLVPVYNSYLLYRMAWSGRAFLYEVVCAIVMLSGVIGTIHASIAVAFGTGSGVMVAVWGIVTTTASVASFVLTVIRAVKLAHAFGRETVWAVGLVLIPSVFYVLLGFMSDVSYVGPDDGSGNGGHRGNHGGHDGQRPPRPASSGGHVNYSELR